jgi:hypothetical protein
MTWHDPTRRSPRIIIQPENIFGAVPYKKDFSSQGAGDMWGLSPHFAAVHESGYGAKLMAQSGHSLRCNAMSAFGGKADIDQQLLIDLDL